MYTAWSVYGSVETFTHRHDMCASRGMIRSMMGIGWITNCTTRCVKRFGEGQGACLGEGKVQGEHARAIVMISQVAHVTFECSIIFLNRISGILQPADSTNCNNSNTAAALIGATTITISTEQRTTTRWKADDSALFLCTITVPISAAVV